MKELFRHLDIIQKEFIVLVLFIAVSSFSYSQTKPASISNFISSMDSMRHRMPVEKVYIQFDKPYYTNGDTIRLKAYLFNADYLTAAVKSGILYLELANDTGKVLDRRMLRLTYGVGWGNIVLNKEDIPAGSYTLNAYTNWMRNFGEDYIFKKNFFVNSMATDSWLVSSAIQRNKIAGKDSIRMTLQFRQLNGDAVGLKELQFRLTDGKRTWFRNKFQTSAEGKFDLNFILPEKADGRAITLKVEDPAKGQEDRKIPIPVVINRPENTDLQFMPEGGSMIAGITSKVGFKAISEDGNSTDISGKIYNNSEALVTDFVSMHKGMGAFILTPVPGERYTAKISLPDGTIKSYPLPATKSSGTALAVENTTGSDSVVVKISTSDDQLNTTYHLIGQSRGIVCYAASITLTGKQSTRKVPKNAFPTGIAKFSLLTAADQPVNERIIFIDHQDNLQITVTPDRSGYASRDSISLSLEVKDKEGTPVRGSFSLAVTDDHQVSTDDNAGNILTSMLMTSDLNGTVEDPGYYFRSTDQILVDLDNLLLTQGWTGYDPIAIQWKEVFGLKTLPLYKTEPEFMVNGKVRNVFNKPLAGTSIRLLSTRPEIIRDALTDQQGLFSFKNFPPLDTAKFLIQATNKNDKSFNIGIEVEEFKPPVFKTTHEQIIPWYMNTDTTLLRNINTSIAQQPGNIPGGTILQEVTIIGKKVIKDSYNLNEPGDANFTFDERDMEKGGKKTLAELLRQRLPGVYKDRTWYKYKSDWIFLRIDGEPASQAIYMDYLTAEDIKGIEVMSSLQYTARYFAKYYPLALRLPPITFVEVTTWSGKGPSMKKTPGTYFYKSLPFVSAKAFYRPKYPAKDNPSATLTDLRSTIHWVPNIITDKEGKAFVSFYSADRPGTYTIIMEGSDMNGNVGYKQEKITINSK